MKDIREMAEAISRFERPGIAEWDKVEDQLGLLLPQDFKQIVSLFGSGIFGNLVLLNPSSSRPDQELLSGVHSCAQDTVFFRKDWDFPLFPTPNGYLRLGLGTERTDLLWRFESGASEDWVWVDWEYQRAIRLAVSLEHLLVGAFHRTLRDPQMCAIGERIWTEDMLDDFFISFPPIH